MILGYKCIERTRVVLGWTQEVLAGKAIVPLSEVKRIEGGAVFKEVYLFRVIDTLMGSMSSEQLIQFGRDLENLEKGVTGRKWSRKYNRCIQCEGTDSPHMARGLCLKCYDQYSALKHTKHRIEKSYGDSSSILTKEYLLEQYVEKKKSLSDIARESNCSRQYVHKKMKLHNIPLRDKSAARLIALDENKIEFERKNDDGSSRRITLSKVRCTANFFSTWTDEMAYVLGVIYTDGSLNFGKSNPRQLSMGGRLTIGQKEPELLEKVLALLNCDAKIHFNPRRQRGNIVAGELYYFHIYDNALYEDLLRLGLSPNKSLTLSFPEIPKEYIRHFIRGCWDGDGSIYCDKKRRQFSASYVSGSIEFIKGMTEALYREGFLERNIEISQRKNPSYAFRYSGTQVRLLFHYLYDNVPETQYLKRKYDLFKTSVNTNS